MVSHQEDHIWQINITPLTDVFLVLLIIFMVATPFLVQEAVKVHLPSSAMGKPEPKAIVVTLDKGNKVYVDGEEVKISLLSDFLKSRLSKEENLVILRGDKMVSLGDAIKVMDIIKRAGAERIAIATEQPTGR
ncbi:biopolymer transporter ExbD [bacterium]|nr:biopolymer transporter ExbD [bacterium]MBU1600102.1 biopolymer transporter ExbD [bacterium]MBU2461349.1 biopolymer transporter ExbD [bacterium]